MYGQLLARLATWEQIHSTNEMVAEGSFPFNALAEHKVLGGIVLPGVGYVELAYGFVPSRSMLSHV